jgi:Family of unknown function (DUF6232)
MEDDEIVYNAGNIIISKTLARFGGVTYPVNGIGSVYVAKPKRIGLIIFGLIMGAVGLALLRDDKVQGGGIVFIGIGVVLIIVAITKAHRLMLRTASGDQQAYESRSAKELLQIKAAIERAVMLRG